MTYVLIPILLLLLYCYFIVVVVTVLLWGVCVCVVHLRIQIAPRRLRALTVHQEPYRCSENSPLHSFPLLSFSFLYTFPSPVLSSTF